MFSFLVHSPKYSTSGSNINITNNYVGSQRKLFFPRLHWSFICDVSFSLECLLGIIKNIKMASQECNHSNQTFQSHFCGRHLDFFIHVLWTMLPDCLSSESQNITFYKSKKRQREAICPCNTSVWLCDLSQKKQGSLQVPQPLWRLNCAARD